MINFGTVMPIHRQIEDWAIEKQLFGPWYWKIVGTIIIFPFYMCVYLYVFFVMIAVALYKHFIRSGRRNDK